MQLTPTHPLPVISPQERTRRIAARRGCAGFTLIEILSSVAIVVVLSSLLLGSLSGTMADANRATCVSNLRTVSSAVLTYATDNGGSYPPPLGDGTAVSWDGEILSYLPVSTGVNKPNKVLQCPEDKRPAVIDSTKFIFPRSYKLSSQPAQQKDSPMGVVGYWDEGTTRVGLARRVAQLTRPSDTILLFECFTDTTITPGYIDNWQYHDGDSVGSGWASGPRVTGYRADGSKKLYHGKYLNYAMADGHVETRDLVWPYTPNNRWNAIR